MAILNMSQFPLRRLGFLQHIGRLAVVIWETFLTKNRHVECKHRKPTPSYTTYVRIGFRMFDKRLAGKDSMHRTSPKIVNQDQSVSHAVFLPFEHRHCNKGANMMKPPENMKAARGCFASKHFKTPSEHLSVRHICFIILLAVCHKRRTK